MTLVDMEAERPDLELLYLDDAHFRELAKNECFKREPDEISEWLRNRFTVERFASTLRALTADLASQLTQYKEASERSHTFDEHWRARTRRLKAAVDKTLAEIAPLAQEARRERHEANQRRPKTGTNSRELWRQVRTLRWAIHTHKDACAELDLEPEDHDVALWAFVDGDIPQVQFDGDDAA